MPKQRRQRPSVSIVGAGRLGGALAIALARAGYRLDAVVTRRQASARRASALFGGKLSALAGNQLGRLPPSDLIVISTPDDAISAVAQKLADLQTVKARGRIFLHTSGALSSAALAPLSAKGFAVGSLHPLLAISHPKETAGFWRGAFWCIEGEQAATRAARQIVADLEGQSFTIRAEKKPLYHAAAVMASGHVVALFDIAIEMLVQSGLTAERASEVLLPLVESTVRNLKTVRPAQALTGTFTRGDFATVERHLRALSASGLEEALTVYRILGGHSLQLAERNKGGRQALKEIKKLLRKRKWSMKDY